MPIAIVSSLSSVTQNRWFFFAPRRCPPPANRAPPRVYVAGYVCENVLVSGFEAGVGSDQRAETVEEAVRSAAILVDKSHWGIIRVEGQDRLRFLHSQGTNAFEGVNKGE